MAQPATNPYEGFVAVFASVSLTVWSGEFVSSFDLTSEWLLEWGKYVGYPMVALISIIGVRLLLYFRSFFLHWPRYRQLRWVTTADLKALPDIPFIKVQVTTRGAPGSTEVIRRGIQCVVGLANPMCRFFR